MVADVEERIPARAYAAALEPFAGALDAGALLDAAQYATGLGDWGGARWDEERFRHDFAILCDAIEENGLSAVARDRSHSRLHTMLVSRLRYIDARKTAPGVDWQEIVAPLIGTGMPRAGTTFLHGLLAQDPGNRVARAFEAAIPAPVGGDAALYRDILAFQGLTDADIMAIHPFGADLPEECIFLQEGDCGSLYTVHWTVPAFEAAIAGKAASAFRWQRGIMEYLQALQPGSRWALKAPGHMHVWTEMRMAFPDAKIYVNHRDPGKVIPSIASLFIALRQRFSDENADPRTVGPQQLAAWSGAMTAYADWRTGPGADADVIDIHYADLVARPLETVATLYDRFEIDLAAEARDRMERHLDADHHGKAPKRRYTLAEYGLDEAAIEAAFGRYIDHFGIQREARL